MNVIQSLGSLVTLNPDWLPQSASGSLSLYVGRTADFATIYRTEPSVRTVVDFLARNVAQLGLHVFRRVSDTDRLRLSDHGLARLIARPNPWTTRYRLLESLMVDLGIYFNAYWAKIRGSNGGIAVLRIPPPLVGVEGGFAPTKYVIETGVKRLEIEPSAIVHFRGPNPDSMLQGLSPMVTLRRVLAEDAASGAYREAFWRNAARHAGVIERPKDAPEWSETARKRFLADFASLYSGEANSGRTAVLEEGMTWKQSSFSAEESQYLEARKLTREEVTRQHHTPLPMVGILDHATFSNVAEQHKHLYQDTLGPTLKMIEEEIELQLLPEFDDTENVYVEFNLAEKLKGSFEEQAASLSSAVGRPWLTADEARGRQNLPSLGGDADQLVTPLNVLVGGQASPRDSAPPPKALPGRKAVDGTYAALRRRHVEKWTEVMVEFFERQGRTVAPKLPKKDLTPRPPSLKGRGSRGGVSPPKRDAGGGKAALDSAWDDERWDRELAEDLLKLNAATATVFGQRVARAYDGEFDADALLPLLTENAKISAKNINGTTRAQLATALDTDDPAEAIKRVFEVAAGSRSERIAQSKVTNAANLGGHEAAAQSGAGKKTWQVNSGNPRSSHAAVDGETVDLDDTFSNGLRWPGDAAGDADELANCECSVEFSGGRG